MCARGAECRYSHDITSVIHSSNAPRPCGPTEPCFDFLRCVLGSGLQHTRSVGPIVDWIDWNVGQNLPRSACRGVLSEPFSSIAFAGASAVAARTAATPTASPRRRRAAGLRASPCPRRYWRQTACRQACPCWRSRYGSRGDVDCTACEGVCMPRCTWQLYSNPLSMFTISAGARHARTARCAPVRQPAAACQRSEVSCCASAGCIRAAESI